MGLDYSFNLFVRDEELPLLLRSLQPLIEPVRPSNERAGADSAQLRATLVVDGQAIDLACTSGFEGGSIVELERGPQSAMLVLSINVPWEEELWVDFDDWDDGRTVSIGCMFATITRWARTSLVEFVAATTQMSLHFQRSASIRRTFAALAERCGAELVVLDLEGGEFETLDDPPRRVQVEIEGRSAGGESLGELDPPSLLASIRAALAAQRSP
jgi:hypothetical protein